MESPAWLMMYTYFLSLTLGIYVHANHLDLKFKPEINEYVISDVMAMGTFYGIFDDNQVSNENAAIYCLVNSKYAKLEFILPSEPPKSLSVENMNKYLPSLQDSTIYCSVSQILDINKWPDEKGSQYTGKTGKVRYRSEGTQNITIEISGFKLRKVAATHPQDLRIQASPLIQASISIIKEECLKDVWDGEGDDSSKYPKLGELCSDPKVLPQKRWMLNSLKELACGQCCSKNFWFIKMKTCIPCSTQNESNVWTNCKHDTKPNRIDASTTATLPTTEQPNSTTSLPDFKTIGTATEPSKEINTVTEGKNNDSEPTPDPMVIRTESPEEDAAIDKSSKPDPIPIIPWYFYLIGVVSAITVIVMIGVGVCYLKKWCWFRENEGNAIKPIKQSELEKLNKNSESTSI